MLMHLLGFVGMETRNRKILFSVHESPQLPRELWDRFKATASRRGETWIAALRRLIEQYIAAENGRPTNGPQH